MDTLEDTHWDVVIAGTGLQESLLALYVLLTGLAVPVLTDAENG